MTSRRWQALAIALLVACGAPRRDDPPRRDRSAPRSGPRGVYVADTVRLLDDADAARALAGFDRVVFYGLGDVFDEPAREARFAALVGALHLRGVNAIGAPIAAPSRVDEVLAYNRRHPEARIDLLVSEVEYWHGCAPPASEAPPDLVRACFAPMEAVLSAMRAAADESTARGAPLAVGAYLGYPTRAEVRRIAARVDHVLVNYAVTAPARARDHVHRHGGSLRRRLRWLADAGVEVWPIFYARGEVDMGAWLAAHGLDAAEAVFCADVARDPDLAALRLGGFQYFPVEALGALIGAPSRSSDRPIG